MVETDNFKLIHEKTATRLREIVGRSRGILGMCAVDLTSGERFAVNEHTEFPQASAIKVPVLMEIFKQATEGKFKLSDSRRIVETMKTGGSGVLFELGAGTVEMSLHDLCVLMILVSDNTATNILIDLVGMASVNRTMLALGAGQTRVRRRMMDLTASERGEENVSTPADAARIMEILHKGEFVSRELCGGILAILRKPKPQTNVAQALPAGTVIAGKPGHIGGVTTEWAIVEVPNRPYVVTVMESFGAGKEGDALMQEMVRVVHEHFSRMSRVTDLGVFIR